MAGDLRAIVLLVHLLGTLLMAAPFYMLIMVNERARFAVPPGYNPDRYMENIIKSQPQRCYVYLGTVLVTGALLTLQSSDGLALIFSNWALAVKVAAFVVLIGLLSYVHFGLQPKIEALLSQGEPNSPLAEALRPQLASLRLRRKRLSATCLFLVLTSVIMGIQVFTPYSLWLVVLFLILAALFAWRAFTTPARYGWL